MKKGCMPFSSARLDFVFFSHFFASDLVRRCYAYDLSPSLALLSWNFLPDTGAASIGVDFYVLAW